MLAGSAIVGGLATLGVGGDRLRARPRVLHGPARWRVLAVAAGTLIVLAGRHRPAWP